MFIYKGKRYSGGDFSSDNIVLFSRNDGKDWEKLEWGLEWINHSPTGLNWGYHGSGCAQLAFAILHNYFVKRLCYTPDHAFRFIEGGFYQAFKRDFVAKWGDAWELEEKEIDNWIINNLSLLGKGMYE